VTLDAPLEYVEQIGLARDLLTRRRRLDRLAARLALDQRQHLLAVGVLVAVRLELGGELVDQQARRVHL
jgi:hypothetical protein